MANNKVPAKGKQTIKENGEFTCTSCGVIYKRRQGNFLKSGSPLFKNNFGYVNICKSCTESLYKDLLGAFDGDAEKALDRVCQIFDWYYSKAIVSATGKDATASRVLLYPSKMNMNQFHAAGKVYLDSILENKTATDDEDLKKSTDILLDEYVAPPETIKFFGHGHGNEDYLYLSEQFAEWTSDLPDGLTKTQQEIYIGICFAQLTLRKALRGGVVKEIEQATKTLQILLDSQGITPKKSSVDILGERETFGTLIKKLENDRPVRDPDPQWADVDDIKKYYETWFLGHLCNLVEIHNDAEEMYLEELEKYTVTPPQAEELYGTGETSILDRFSKNKRSEEPDD